MSKLGKQTTLQFKALKKEREKKKNPWSDEEDEDEEPSASGSAGEPSPDIAPREKIQRATKSEHCY